MTAEQTKFQVVASNHKGQLTRPYAAPFESVDEAMEKAVQALNHPEASEAFVVTVHAAFKKGFTVERTL